jgi:probable rRNA maturation factor
VLNIICEDARWIIPQDLEVTMSHVLKTVRFKPLSEINLIFGNNKLIQSLNRQYRKKDSPTDVLAFPLLEKKALDDVWNKKKNNLNL